MNTIYKNVTTDCKIQRTEDGSTNDHVEYEICKSNGVQKSFAYIKFQRGAVNDVGVNGCYSEDILIILIDRLKEFQSGPLSCRESSIAYTRLEEALMWLQKRTSDRISRGVEGTNKK